MSALQEIVTTSYQPTESIRLPKLDPLPFKAKPELAVSLFEIRKDNPTPQTVNMNVNAEHLALEATVLLATLGSPIIRIVDPITVSLHEENGTFVASWEGSDDFGYGSTYVDALGDFRAVLAELFVALEEDSDRLGPEPERTLITLRKHFVYQPVKPLE